MLETELGTMLLQLCPEVIQNTTALSLNYRQIILISYLALFYQFYDAQISIY